MSINKAMCGQIRIDSIGQNTVFLLSWVEKSEKAGFNMLLPTTIGVTIPIIAFNAIFMLKYARCNSNNAE
jgi:hypothetical protein